MSIKKRLIAKLKSGKFSLSIAKWILISTISSSVLILAIHYSNKKSNSSTSLDSNKKDISPNNSGTNENTSDKSSALSETKKIMPVFYNTIPAGKGIQLIKNILKENADCSGAIIDFDSILYSPNSPKGGGNISEIKDNKHDDTLYFENEHNTIWYKFIAKENGNLTFDIIPVNQNDDYDFILYRYNGNDFSSKVITKEIKPLRTCISRNDKKIKSMTGLTLNESAKRYIHSGPGSSYVKYVRVKKRDILYLLVDNLNNNGDGHSIRFHYKTFAKGELYVGELIPFKSIKFMSNDYYFKPNAEGGLDSLYQFMTGNPTIKIEIQGHVNSAHGDIVQVREGERYTELQLSQKRAEAIYNFLVSKGIDCKRIACIGFGSTRMLIPNARTPKDCQTNIRAEIVITSFDYKKDFEQ